MGSNSNSVSCICSSDGGGDDDDDGIYKVHYLGLLPSCVCVYVSVCLSAEPRLHVRRISLGGEGNALLTSALLLLLCCCCHVRYMPMFYPHTPRV